MPALDHCHENVVRALVKAGWIVAPKPFSLKIERGHTLFIDLAVSRVETSGEQVILLVEVKCFPADSADTSELYTALGQYIIYRSLLNQQRIKFDLYLAVPTEAYQNIFTRMALNTIAENQIKMVVVDIEREVVIQWLI
ncbi:MAG TPA: element excision factor XisH family protein [Phototrophicaceae bacterium]|nr:element excision factor XisH family protein [Phototrophicaceae bacterium]